MRIGRFFRGALLLLAPTCALGVQMVPVGGEFAVNTYTTNHQSRPSVAMDQVGGFVVVWQSFLQDGSDFGVFGQRYDHRGSRAGTEFQVNTTTSLGQYGPSVVMDAAGNYLVVWASYFQGTMAQRFEPTAAHRRSR